MDPTVVVALVFLGASSLSLIVIAWQADTKSADQADRPFTFLLLLSGAVMGYVFGTIGSPLNSKEESAFAGIQKAIALLVSGYLLGKLELLVNPIFSGTAKPLFVRRALIFLCAFLISAMATFVARKYV